MSLASEPFKLITIIAEPVLEPQLVRELRALGATGWTITESRGEGSRGLHAGELPGVGIRIEVVVAAATAEQIVEHVAANYFSEYSVVAYVTDVSVIRPEKFRARAEG